jgi:xanthine dehydrogenase iron-sulfur cluster and FAD-binding subunit A
MHPDAVFLSGATDVGLRITKQQRRIGAVIYAGRVRALPMSGGRSIQIAVSVAA